MMAIIAATILVAYIIYVVRLGGGIPSSLSASVFNLPQSRRWIWTVVIFSVTFLCIGSFIGKTPEKYQVLAFLAIASFAFVGATPLVKDPKDMAYKVHYIAAYTCSIVGQVILLLCQPALLLCWVPWIMALPIMWKKDIKAFWAEMACLVGILAYCIV